MATLTDLAARALGELSLVVAGETPATEDAATALSVVLDLMTLLPEVGAGRDMQDREVTEACIAGEDQRVLCQVGGITVTTPYDPRDGARFAVLPIAGGTITVTPYRRTIEGGSVSLSVTTATVWYYRADQGDWVKVTALESDDDSPYPPWCDLPIVHLAAEELAAQYERPLPPALIIKIEASRSKLRGRFGRPRERDWGAMIPATVRGPGRLYR